MRQSSLLGAPDWVARCLCRNFGVRATSSARRAARRKNSARRRTREIPERRCDISSATGHFPTTISHTLLPGLQNALQIKAGSIQMHDLLYAKQDSLGLKSLDSFALDAGVLDMSAFRNCNSRSTSREDRCRCACGSGYRRHGHSHCGAWESIAVRRIGQRRLSEKLPRKWHVLPRMRDNSVSCENET